LGVHVLKALPNAAGGVCAAKPHLPVEGVAMYPAVPAEVCSGAVNLVCYFFTVIAVLVTLALTARAN